MTQKDPIAIRLPIAFIDALSQADGLEAVLLVGAQWLPQMFPVVRGSIGFYDENRLISHVAYSDGSVDPPFDISQIDDDSPRSRVLRSGNPVILRERDMQTSNIAALQALYDAGVRSMLIAPMLGGGRPVGVLSLACRADSDFTANQIEKLTGIGKFVAAQAQLMQQVRNAARLAETDGLTGLANRARLMRVLDGPQALHVPDAQGRVLGVLQIDLDHFKEVNDTLGHAVGDAILRHAATAMQRAAAPKDLVARVGGDEFVVVTRTDRAGRHLARLAHRIRRAAGQPHRIGDTEARVGVSIGTAVATEQDISADRLIGNADIALYEVKRRGRGGVRAFNSAMRAACERRIQLLSDMHLAVEQQRFEPHFQPQVSMQTGHFSGFEMLARWPHPTLGLVDPEDFIDLAVEAGLSDKIDKIVRAKGLRALRDLRNAGWHAPKMSFNASARTLGDPELVQQLLWEVLQQGLGPEDLVLEVRETDLIALGSDLAFDHINTLSAAGFDVELDDFGAGHAAMTNLGRLAISGVKLDRSIIAPLPDRRAKAILRAVIAMAKELGLGVVAEGVETAQQFATLRQLGCHIAQGFGVSKPLPLDGLIDFMQGYGQAPVTLAIAST